MHRNDSTNYFLYIEPNLVEKSEFPIDDEYTKAIEYFFKRSKSGGANYSKLDDLGTFDEGNGWRGFHMNCDDERSDNHDYLLENGYITNSLCVYYVCWFRQAITGHNLEKLENLRSLYVQKMESLFPSEPVTQAEIELAKEILKKI